MGSKERERLFHHAQGVGGYDYPSDEPLIPPPAEGPVFESEEQQGLYALAGDATRLLKIAQEAIKIGTELSENRTLKSTAHKRLAQLKLMLEMTVPS